MANSTSLIRKRAREDKSYAALAGGSRQMTSSAIAQANGALIYALQ